MMAVVNRGRRLTLETKLRVLDMRKKNFSLQKIRDLLARENISVTRQGIHSFLRTWTVSGTLSRRRRSDRGERKKIRTIHMKFMDMWLAEDNELTTADLCKKLHSVFGIELSASLVGEVRRKMGWKTCGARYCQLISHKNKKVRMQWCLNALNTNEDFRDVVFVDESSVEMSSNGRLFFHQDASKIQMKCLRRPKPKHAYKVHVWAGISYRGRTGICIFSGIMDSVIYQKILEDNLLPFVEKKFPDGFRLYQDNDSKHNSKSTKAWIEKRGIKE